MSCKEITAEYNKYFNENVQSSNMKTALSRYKIKLANSGKFQKGREPKNKVPIGTERKTKGYWLIKVAEPNEWTVKHRHIWEEYHNIKIPEGHVITFLDGNVDNFNIKNLKCISQVESQLMNSKKLRFDNAELTDAGVQVAKYINKVNQISKGRCENE